MTYNNPSTRDNAVPVVLVIDDELGPRESLRFLLKDDYRVLCADTVDRGLEMFHEQTPDSVIIDIRMPGKNGIEGLREIRRLDPELSVIILTGFAAVETAQEAIRNEASDYVEKPFDATEMRRTVQRGVMQTRLRRKRSHLFNEADTLDSRIRELQQKSRLVELGQSSSEFVHDLRNALTIVTGSSSLLRMEVEDLRKRQEQAPTESIHYIDLLETAVRQCVEMLDTWQGMIADTPKQVTRFRVRKFVGGCVNACLPVAEMSGVRLECEACVEDVDLLGDYVQLTRVLANLIHNAINAMPTKNGRIRVQTEICNTSVHVSVMDNGCGIQEENLRQLFKPNFTTRSTSGGTGMGLFIARKIAQAHNGDVTVESVVDQGSTFTLVLPKAEAVIGETSG